MSDKSNVFQIRLKQAMHEKKMKAVELSAITGLSKARISQYTNGVYVPKSQAVFLIASALGVSEAWLLGIDDEKQRPRKAVSSNNISNISGVIDGEKIYRIPVFESVSAGFGAYAANEIVDYIPTIINNPYDVEDTIAIRVTGDSMYPKIEDGDIIVVRRQTSVDSGSIGVVLLDDGEGLVKFIVYGSTWIELRSLNENYPVQRFDGAEVQRLRVVGKVQQIIKRL